MEFEATASFDPDNTGSELPDHLLRKWHVFCSAVRRSSPDLYNTWIENRHGRAAGWGPDHKTIKGWHVQALPDKRSGGIKIVCPSKVWRDKLADLLAGEWAKIVDYVPMRAVGMSGKQQRGFVSNGTRNGAGQTYFNGEWYPLTDAALASVRDGLGLLEKRRGQTGELNRQDKALYGLGQAMLQRHDEFMQKAGRKP